MPRIHVPGKKLKAIADKDSHRPDPVSVKLTGDIHHYLTRVLRLRPSDPVTLFDGERIEAFGRIIAVDRRTVTVEINAARFLEPRDFPELVLICAMLKRPKMDWVIQKATELGTDTIVPVHFTRSVPKLDPSRTKNRLARWKKIAKSAAGQCGRINIPKLHSPAPDLPAALSGSPGQLTPNDWGVVLWEQCQKPALPHAPPDDLGRRNRALVVIGPEGGLTAEEIQAATKAGFAPASLGRLILRSETAVISALTLLAAACGRLD